MGSSLPSAARDPRSRHRPPRRRAPASGSPAGIDLRERALTKALHAPYLDDVIARVKYEVIDGDLLEQKADVIVNAWNRNVIPWWLLLPQGVSGAIKRRAGLAPFRELARRGPMPLGSAVLTAAGNLPYAGIIHVAGINLLWRASERSI